MGESAIFSLRFGSNALLEPTQEELKSFLQSKKEGTREAHGADLAPYWELLTAVAEYKTSGAKNFHDKMLYAVLSHSQFAKPALKSAVEQYKYHVHKLASLDFRKPTAFIKSAEEEIARLNPKKKDDSARLERMRAMIEERKMTIEDQKKHWLELIKELGHIISYIADNLSRIEKLCDKTISILVNEQVEGKKQGDLVGEIRNSFKERLRDSLHRGTITKEHLENAKEEVAELSKRTGEIVLSDIYTMTQLYEVIHECCRTALRDMAAIKDEIVKKKSAIAEEELEVYRRAEKTLVTLVSGCRFDVKTIESVSETEHEKLLAEIRRESVDHLINLLPQQM